MLAHHGLQPVVVEKDPVEAGERHRLRVGDLHDRVIGGRRAVQTPGARGSPADDEPTPQVCQVLGDDEVEGAQFAVVGDFAAVLDHGPEAGPVAALADEHHPEPGRVRWEYPRLRRLPSRVLEDFVVGRVGVDARKTAVLVLAHEGVADRLGIGRIDAGAAEYGTEGQGHGALVSSDLPSAFVASFTMSDSWAESTSPACLAASRCENRDRTFLTSTASPTCTRALSLTSSSEFA